MSGHARKNWRALALARCARLPLKTAEETRRRVEAGLNVRVA
ncbi:MAG: hypothetical protein R3E84_11135 [Pseudomonadales bacterium]